MAVPASTQTVVLDVIGTFKLSTISLKKNGTWTLSTFPPTSSANAPSTRIFVLGELRGHIFSASFMMIRQSVCACDFSDLVTVT
jgi:hypothetical protein